MKASHIKVVQPYNDIGCLCGRAKSFALCSHCSYSKVAKIDALCNKAVNLLGKNVAETTINQMHCERNKIFKNMWMKNNKF